MIINNNLIKKDYKLIFNILFKYYYDNYYFVLNKTLTREDVEELIHDSILRYIKIYKSSKSHISIDKINFLFLKKIFRFKLIKLNAKYIKRILIYKKFVQLNNLLLDNKLQEKEDIRFFLDFIINNKFFLNNEKLVIIKRLKYIYKKNLSNSENKLFYKIRKYLIKNIKLNQIIGR